MSKMGRTVLCLQEHKAYRVGYIAQQHGHAPTLGNRAMAHYPANLAEAEEAYKLGWNDAWNKEHSL